MSFFDLIDAAKRAARPEPGVVGREPRHPRIAFGQFEVRSNLVFKLLVETIAVHEREEPPDLALHDFASRKRMTSAFARRQRCTSRSSCFRPAFVSA